MSYVRVNITDAHEVLIGEIHGSMGEPLVAALTAEPENITEMETALDRFVKFESDWTFFGRMKKYDFKEPLEFRYHLNLETYDAGILVIDLAGKIVAVDSTYDSYSKKGTIGVADKLADEKDAEFPLPYQLSDEWRFVYSVEDYEGIARKRREERLKNPPFDARKILFGEPLFEFIAKELQNADDLENERLFTEIHEKWLMTARDDLNGKTPREILMEKRNFIDFDLHSRSLQWSFINDCPPNLLGSSNAYKFAGFGTHEIVVYYDLIRFLLKAYKVRLMENEKSDAESEINFLSDTANRWLNAKDPEFSGRIPLQIIESERVRRNQTMSAHECLIDEDCPICVGMSEIFDTPMFWHLDGCNMDEEFAFSFYDTREEWEKCWAMFEDFDSAKTLFDEDLSVFDNEIIE